ncbi:duf814 domain-containing protein [Seiridium cupressi]
MVGLQLLKKHTTETNQVSSEPSDLSSSILGPSFWLSLEPQLPHDFVVSNTAWAQDLYLMSHFISQTSMTLTTRHDMLHMWQQLVPMDAVQYPFLAHGMLSLAALHLAAIDSNKRLQYSLLYHFHQSKAIPDFRQALADQDPQCAGPCFAMAHLLSAVSFASISDNAPCGFDGSRSVATLDTMLSLFISVRGLMGITLQLEEQLLRPPYNIDIRVPEISNAPLPPDLSNQFEKLTHIIHQGVENHDPPIDSRTTDTIGNSSDSKSPNKGACLDALFHLEVLQRESLSHERRREGMFASASPYGEIDDFLLPKWLIKVPDQYVIALREKDPTALQILVKFAEIAQNVGHRWCLKNSGSNMISAIENARLQ